MHGQLLLADILTCLTCAHCGKGGGRGGGVKQSLGIMNPLIYGDAARIGIIPPLWVEESHGDGFRIRKGRTSWPKNTF